MSRPDLSTSPRAIWRLAWPQMLMMYLVFIMGLITVWVAGQISADVQAALGMVTQCTLLLMVIVMAMSSGALAAVSQSLGAQRLDRAQRYVSITVLGSFGLGFVMAAAGWLLADPILLLLRVPERILPLARDFWDVVMLTLPAQYVYAATGVMFRATRQVIPPLQVAALLCALTLAGSLGFGLGWFGLPAYGAHGILWTNFAAQLAGALCNCLLLRRSNYLHRHAVPDRRWLRVGLPYLLRVALPAGAAQDRLAVRLSHALRAGGLGARGEHRRPGRSHGRTTGGGHPLHAGHGLQHDRRGAGGATVWARAIRSAPNASPATSRP